MHEIYRLAMQGARPGVTCRRHCGHTPMTGSYQYIMFALIRTIPAGIILDHRIHVDSSLIDLL